MAGGITRGKVCKAALPEDLSYFTQTDTCSALPEA